MAEIQDLLKKGLNEARTTVLGAQILLGFQYEALFQPRFGRLQPLDRGIEATAFAVLLLVVTLMLAPAPFHRLAQGGEATLAQRRYTDAVVAAALVLFAGAIGLNLVLALSGELGRAAALAAAAVSVALCLFLWFGLELLLRRPDPEPPMKDAKLPLKEKIAELMTETRIILPGVQALLGFQFAAYFTDLFHRLPPAVRAIHTASLLLLLAAMILLMGPAAFHRLAEGGENTARADRMGAAFMLGGLAALAFGLSADFYVALEIATGAGPIATGGAALAAAVSLGVWFAWPMLARRRGARASGPSGDGPAP